jgi:hypothetical protein
MLYRKFYKCSECGHEWEDAWDCLCNDRCPECNAEIEPHDWGEAEEPDPGDMDGDHETGLTSAGWGTDEDYMPGGYEEF